MWKTAKRIVIACLMLTLICSSFTQPGWGLERQSLVKEAWAWAEDGEIRVQALLQPTKDEIEVVIKQESQEVSYVIKDEKRFSIAVQPFDDQGALTIEWIRDGTKKPELRWQVPLSDSVRSASAQLDVREAPWDREAEKKEGALDLIEVAEQGETELGTFEKANRKQTEVQRLADDFYADFTKGKSRGKRFCVAEQPHSRWSPTMLWEKLTGFSMRKMPTGRSGNQAMWICGKSKL